MSDDAYFIWSVEHGQWWLPGRHGYTKRFSEAGRYSRQDAIAICTRSIPGTSTELGSLPELPVRVADLHEMTGRYFSEYSDRPEPWR